MRPHIFLAAFQFGGYLFQIHIILITEQAMATQPLHSRTGSDVLRIDIALLNAIPIVLQRLSDERGGMDFGGAVMVVAVLRELLGIGKSFTKLAMSCSCFFVAGRPSGTSSTRSRVPMYFT